MKKQRIQLIKLNQIVEEEINYLPKQKINLMHEFEDFKVYVIEQKKSIFKWLKDVHNTDCFSFYNRQDLKPFFYTLLEKLRIRL